jgi:SAM-dependent methyltransferase
LFEHLASLAPSRDRAWDCATGSGQAALGLAPFFSHVIATDASSAQIAHAVRHEKISYSVSLAEQAGIESRSMDLIAVAQAVHWFDMERFYREAKRVVKSDGVIAVWCYSLLRIAPAIDELLDRFYHGVVGPYWPPERKLIDERYATIPFPFEELTAPSFTMEALWDARQLLGYLATWSSVKRYRQANGVNPVLTIEDPLIKEWGDPESAKDIRWDLNLRIGKPSKEDAQPGPRTH